MTKIDKSQHKFTSISEYNASFPEPVRKKLEQLRNTIKESVPDAVEVISYNMPAFKLNKLILVYFAAHKEHIGFYPGSAVVNVVFKDELNGYETSKGTIRFYHDTDLPIELIKKIIAFRHVENLQKISMRKK